MDIPEIDFTIWWLPHRAWGYVVNIMAMPDDQIPVRGFFQSFADLRGTSSQYPYFDPDYPHREFEVTAEAFLPLCHRANGLSYRFAGMRPLEQTGGSFFGLRLERASQEFIVKWHGRFDGLQDEDIKSLYRQIQHLAGESDPG